MKNFEFLIPIAVTGLIIGFLFFIVNRPTPRPSPGEFKHIIQVIDGCEYLKFRLYHYDSITHKGNCKNHEQ